VHRSPDLVHWEFMGFALEPAESGWAWSDLWAREVVYERGTFYMYISATSRRDPSSDRDRWDEGEGDDGARRLGVARSPNPLGPFVIDDQPLLDDWSIDGHPFRDDDGQMWLFYNVRTQATRVGEARGTGTVCDRLLAPDRLEGAPSIVTFPSQAWEGPYGDWYWNEGPYVLKRRGVYYQLYSGGFYWDGTYAIGFASAPDPRGPWTKNPTNPIFHSHGRILGPGHNSFVFGPDAATRYAVYHAYLEGEAGRKVHLDRHYWRGDRPLVVGPTDGPQPVPPAGVYDPRVPHWRAEAWARGSWVEVHGVRFPLDPADVWHQVEVVQADERFAVRIGGVLVASQPARSGGEFFDTDGDIHSSTVTSFLEDGEVHPLPAGSSYVWRWGGADLLELELAVRGSIVLEVGGEARRIDADDREWELVRLQQEGGTDAITVRALRDGAAVTDLFVYARR
jgi:GH43 family beta-xylosidase